MQKIIPHLWFNTEAKEAAAFYCSAFPHSRIIHSAVLHNTPSGDCDMLTFELSGYRFMSISAGPLFTFNPSVSFMVNFDPARDAQAREHLNALWETLSDGGKVLMEINAYPFSERYGWVQDKYGVSWQLILTDPAGEPRPFIIPSIMFARDMCGKAEEAMNFYVSVFKNAKTGMTARYPAGMEPDKEGTLMFADFMLENQWFACMDSAQAHQFSFNEAISLIVSCSTQEEIDHYWSKLSAVPEAEQCGWLKDKFGLSWQVTPSAMDAMMQHGSTEQIARVTEAFLQMKKFNLAQLQKAYDGQ